MRPPLPPQPLENLEQNVVFLGRDGFQGVGARGSEGSRRPEPRAVEGAISRSPSPDSKRDLRVILHVLRHGLHSKLSKLGKPIEPFGLFALSIGVNCRQLSEAPVTAAGDIW